MRGEMGYSPESRESEHVVKVETLSKEELNSEIRDPETRQPRERFREGRHGGSFKLFLPGKLSDRNVGEVYYPVVREDGEIVGMCELEQDPRNANNFWISFMEVDEAHRGRGYGSQLVNETVRFAAGKGISLEASSYSDDGWTKMKDSLHKAAEAAHVSLRDKERRM